MNHILHCALTALSYLGWTALVAVGVVVFFVIVGSIAWINEELWKKKGVFVALALLMDLLILVSVLTWIVCETSQPDTYVVHPTSTGRIYSQIQYNPDVVFADKGEEYAKVFYSQQNHRVTCEYLHPVRPCLGPR